MTRQISRSLGFLLALTLILVGLPSATAHITTEPTAVETHVLSDEAQDAFYYYDGYDLTNVYVREAHDRVTDENGLVFRFDLYGGFSEASQASQLHIDFDIEAANGTQTFRLTTEDDHNWTGDMTVFALNVTEDEVPFPGVTTLMQAFVPYNALDVEPPAMVGPISMHSYADDDIRDTAPGGYFLPMTGGTPEVTTPESESRRVVSEVHLKGPVGYVDWEGFLDNNTVTVTAENALSSTGQHVYFEPVDTPGWTVQMASEAAGSIEPNGSITFDATIQATPNATAPLPIRIATDLGGAEMFYMGVNGTTLQTGLAPQEVDVDPQQPAPNDSPGLGVLLALAALAGAVLAARRSP